MGIAERLRALTQARVGLGRAGGSLPTAALLDFQMAHSRAQDAVHAAVDWEEVKRGLGALQMTTVRVASAAADRTVYLRRPDLGRTLSPSSAAALKKVAAGPVDLAILVCDGLSASAVQQHACATLEPLLQLVRADGWTIGPVVLAEQARVALQDPVGELLRARVALSLIGERPGLAAPDSLGAYFVFEPRPGKTDADRNCVSNIRAEGLLPRAAAQTLYYLLTQARRRQISGVALKDDRGVLPGATGAPRSLPEATSR